MRQATPLHCRVKWLPTRAMLVVAVTLMCLAPNLLLGGHPHVPSTTAPLSIADSASTSVSASSLPPGLLEVRLGYTDRWSFSQMYLDPLSIPSPYLTSSSSSSSSSSSPSSPSSSSSSSSSSSVRLPRLVVSFTTLPRRFRRYVPQVITALLMQTLPPDIIYVVLPLHPRRGEGAITPPHWLLHGHPRLRVLQPAVDYGPASKLIPALQAEAALGHHDSRIVTVDDDMQTHLRPEMLLNLYAASLHLPDVAVGKAGWNVTCMVSGARCDEPETGLPKRVDSSKYNFVRPAEDYACSTMADFEPGYFHTCMGAVRVNYAAKVDVIEGVSGALYQPRFFDLRKLESIVGESKDGGGNGIGEVPKAFFLTDDVWFSGWLGLNGVDRVIANVALLDHAPLKKMLQERTEQAAMSKVVEGMPESDNGAGAEEGLHSLGHTFIRNNEEGVRWFDERGAWGPRRWPRPLPFKRPTGA